MKAALKSIIPYLAFTMIVVGFVNFFWYFAEGQTLGGDASAGYIRNGRCFVGSHGAYKQVPCEDWERSRIHGISVLVTHPLAMISMGYLLFRFVFPALMGRRRAKEIADRAQLVQGSGAELASARCGGQIGMVRSSKGLLRVSVYPGGIVIRPVFMAPVTILKSEIRSIEVKKQFLSGTHIQINHRARDTLSPLVLSEPPDSVVARAIETVTGMTFPDVVVPKRPTKPVSLGGDIDQTSVLDKFPLILKMLIGFGLLVNFVFLAYGITWAIPSLGLLGVFWTLFALGIAAFNVYTFVLRFRNRW